MVEVLLPPFLITQQPTKNNPGKDAAAVAPVVYSRHQKAKEKEAEYPSARLLVNRLSIGPAPTLAVVEAGAQLDHTPQPRPRG